MVMEKLSSGDFSLEDLMAFAKNMYPYYFSNADKKRESVYYRRVLVYIASTNGIKKYHISKAMDMTHPNILWNYNKAEDLVANRDENFIKCYNDFVNKFNYYMSENTSETSYPDTQDASVKTDYTGEPVIS